jgi:sugar (pentulose or hexulose) kinase
MAKFKEEYKDCTVTVNSPSVGKITINTATVNPNHWANIKEFAFMFEEEKDVFIEEEIEPAPIENNNGLIADSYADFTLNELRERFPNIKATSKKAFIEQIPA